MVLLSKKKIDRKAVQNYVGLTSFQKGENYVIQRAISQGKLKNSVLSAYCQGQAFDPYLVEAILNEHSIQHSYCSCPVGYTGKCKHVAALLLAWLENPELFSEWKEIKTTLEAYDTDTLLELIDLIEDKVEGSTETIQAFSQNLKSKRSPRLAKYFRRIEEAFHLSTLPWYQREEGGITEICFALEKIRSDASQLIQQGNLEEGMSINQVLIQQILNYLDGHRDPWGNLIQELKEGIKGLEKTLQAFSATNSIRLKAFQVLFRVIEEQLYRNYSIGAEEAKRVILAQANPNERDQIISWIHAIQKTYQPFPNKKEEDKNDLDEFLMDLQRDLLDPEVYLSYYRQTGQIQKLVDSLLNLKRVEEASQVAHQQEGFEQTIALADLFLKHQQPQKAEQLILTFLEEKIDFQALVWLKNFYRQNQKNEQALLYAVEIFYVSSQFNYYQEVKELADQLGQWPEMRKQLIDHLKKLSYSSLLIEIYLEEKKMKAAIKLFEQFSIGKRLFKNIHYTSLALNLASAAQYKYPAITLGIYQKAVQELIEERQRDSYQKACDYLKLIRHLYKLIQQEASWENYFKTLMQTFYRLKAFKDEIYRAGLLF